MVGVSTRNPHRHASKKLNAISVTWKQDGVTQLTRCYRFLIHKMYAVSQHDDDTRVLVNVRTLLLFSHAEPLYTSIAGVVAPMVNGHQGP